MPKDCRFEMCHPYKALFLSSVHGRHLETNTNELVSLLLYTILGWGPGWLVPLGVEKEVEGGWITPLSLIPFPFKRGMAGVVGGIATTTCLAILPFVI